MGWGPALGYRKGGLAQAGSVVASFLSAPGAAVLYVPEDSTI